ncbi:MAG: MBL fold metallo-hydrolase [Ruminococcus sp.]|nr:MBL fold metallo-hydrolase [Ruminococcus sp.]
MEITQFVIGMIGTNSYIVSREGTGECVLIDPAVYSEEMVSYIQRKGLHVQAILLTHGHFDHIMGIDGFLEVFPVPVYAHKEEALLLNDASSNASVSYGEAYTYSGAEYVEDGQKLYLAGILFEVLYTPGHTIGGCCYYVAEVDVVFSGDTLFQAFIGRTDFPTGNSSQLVRSIREKLLVLPDETRVYPGHLDETTIGYEKKYNPYL